MPEWFGGTLKEFLLDEINSQKFLNSDIWNGKEVRDFASKKILDNSWQWEESTQFWLLFNAHILLNMQK
jgi:hypothetical protein